MEISQVLSSDRVVCGIEVSSKKRALEAISHVLAETSGIELSDVEIFDGLIARERLGSTGLGHGVAIPHGRFKSLTGTVGVFVKFEHSIDFDAVDSEPVDLVFALMVPEESTEEHLQLLAKLAQMFSDADLRQRLRQSDSSTEIAAILRGWKPAGNQTISSAR